MVVVVVVVWVVVELAAGPYEAFWLLDAPCKRLPYASLAACCVAEPRAVTGFACQQEHGRRKKKNRIDDLIKLVRE